jgi:hypothetical protein
MTNEMIHSNALLIKVAKELLRDQPKYYAQVEHVLALPIIEELFKYRGRSIEEIAEWIGWEREKVRTFVDQNWKLLKL